MMRQLFLWASENEWARRRLPSVPFVRRAVRRFMPGEDVAAALAAARELNRSGLGAVLTLLGENVRAEADTAGVVGHYLDVMGAIHREGLDAEISLKLTHMGLDLDPALASANLIRIASRAAELKQDVAVDMEGSAYTQRTLDLFRTVRGAHGNIGLCLQSYLRRTPQDLETLLPMKPMVRLVKGAYAEPAEIAYPSKLEVDRAFVSLAQRLMRAAVPGEGPRVILGTHDTRLIAELNAWAARESIPPSACEFHLLYGIGREEQQRLVAAGYRVRVLISYGSAWFPWYMRRLAERPANVWFVARSLFTR
jgi:proline dehydrogenase